MKALTFVLLLIFTAGLSQSKFEIREFTGTVNSIHPGWGFALEIVELQVGDDAHFFRIHPMYGKQVLSQLQKGQTISLRANVNVSYQGIVKKMKDKRVYIPYFIQDQITEIKLKDGWVQTPSSQQLHEVKRPPEAKIFLEQKVQTDVMIDGRRGLVFKNGRVSFSNYFWVSPDPLKTINPGDIVSFMGYESPVKEDYIFPIEGVKSVFSFIELKKMIGTIDSYVYKQNYVRMGLVINGKRFSFQAEKARDIDRFTNGEAVLIYFDPDEDPKSNILPTIHAIIQKGDTILMPTLYYGGPDGKHDFKSVQVEGTISKLNRTEKGRIISLILDKDFYVEVDPQMEQQLGNLLKKGSKLKVSGEERIKKEGEIYEKDYRIITPKRIVAESGEFILNR